MEQVFGLAGRGLVVLSTLAVLSCAAITTGTTQSVTVNTDPPGATCTLERDGSQIAIAAPTPQALIIEKSKNDISVICEKPGHQKSASSLSSDLHGMTMANALMGLVLGPIGIGIDAASGAMHNYPPLVNIVLAPESFPSPAERDAFFDRQKLRVESEAQTQVATISRNCGNDEPSRISCQTRIKAIETVRDAEVAQIESQRAAARIVN